MEENMSENFDELGELGDKIKKIIDTAVSTKDYRQMTEDIKQTVGQTVNSAVNSAVDSGSEAIKNGLLTPKYILQEIRLKVLSSDRF